MLLFFLTDCNTIQFYKISRNINNNDYTVSPTPPLALFNDEYIGLKYLCALIKLSPNQLGYQEIKLTIKDIQPIRELIGSGLTSKIYLCENEKVLKVILIFFFNFFFFFQF